jgi:hypothetical protein
VVTVRTRINAIRIMRVDLSDPEEEPRGGDVIVVHHVVSAHQEPGVVNRPDRSVLVRRMVIVRVAVVAGIAGLVRNVHLCQR